MTLRSKILSLGALFVLGTVLLTTSGCKKKPSCELLYTRLDKCIDDFDLKKDKFVKRCNKKKDKAIVKEQIKCSTITDCDKFKTCIKESRKKARAQSIKEDFEKAVKAGKIKQALMTCKYEKKYLTDELKKKCKDLQVKQWKELTAKAIKNRDSGAKNDWELCSTLKSVADGLGDDAKKKEAAGLCDEMSVAPTVAKALKKAKEAMAKPKPSVPFECSWVLGSLANQKTHTEWMKKQRKAVVDLCYKKLGKAVIEKFLAGKSRYCGYDVSKVYTGIKQYHIQDKTLSDLIQKAMPVCKKTFEVADKSLAKKAARQAARAAKKPEARK